LRLEQSLGDSLSPLASLMYLNVSTVLSLVFGDSIRIFGYPQQLALKGKQPLEEVLSLTILVLIVLAIPIAPLYMLYERLMGGESFIKTCLG
jgi:hypothetical protein